MGETYHTVYAIDDEDDYQNACHELETTFRGAVASAVHQLEYAGLYSLQIDSSTPLRTIVLLNFDPGYLCSRGPD